MFPMLISPEKPLPIVDETLGVGDEPGMLLPSNGNSAEAACGESHVPCVVAAPFVALVVGVPFARLPFSDKNPCVILVSFESTPSWNWYDSRLQL
jgi:hypothetical protein